MTAAGVTSYKPDERRVTVHLPDDVARSLEWADGDELAYHITPDKTLALEKK